MSPGKCLCIMLLWILPAPAMQAGDAIRLAWFDTELGRDGPGLLLRDILQGEDPQIEAVVQLLNLADADILMLAGVDHDAGGLTAGALNDRLAHPYPHVIAYSSNAGVPTGADLNGNGRKGDAADAQGYGRFFGAGALVLMSRFPPLGAAEDYGNLLWKDLPGSLIRRNDAGRDLQRLSSSSHVVQRLALPEGPLSVGLFRATPPVFDGPEDRNGRRNHDEISFWKRYLDRKFGAPSLPLVIAGGANLDPRRGEGLRDAISELLNDPRLQDPQPQRRGSFDGAVVGRDETVDWTDPRPGDMRVDYLLPSSDLRVTGSGVLWPAPGEPLGRTVATASRHRLIWLDLVMPSQAGTTGRTQLPRVPGSDGNPAPGD